LRLAERRKAARREEEGRRIEWAEAEHHRLAAIERVEREKDRREELHRQIQVWSRAQEVRAYLAKLEMAAQEHVLRDPDGRLARWLRWGQAYADLIDPLAEVAALPRNPEGYGAKPLELDSFGLNGQTRGESPARNPG